VQERLGQGVAIMQPNPAEAIPGIPSAVAGAVPGTAAFDFAAASLMTAMPGFDPAAWAGIAFPSLLPASTPDLGQQLREIQAAMTAKGEEKKTDKVDRKKAPTCPPGGEVIRLRGLPFSAGNSEVAQFLHEYGVRETNVTMCITESGRADGHAWVVFDSRDVALKAMKEKQRQTIGGRFIELMTWRDHSKEKAPVAITQKVYHGVLKHFDAQRKCGYIFSGDVESDVGRMDVYAFKDVLERGKAGVGDTLAFPLHWSPKGQPQASSPLIRIASATSYAHVGPFKLLGPGPNGRQGGMIESQDIIAVFGRGAYVSPALAATLTPGSLVAFNAYLTTMPSAFAKPPLDGANVVVVSRAMMVDPSFAPPGPDLDSTKTAPGFEMKVDKGAVGAGEAKLDSMLNGIAASAAPDASAEVCRFFAKAGWCKFGNSCRHAHVNGTGGAPSAAQMGMNPPPPPPPMGGCPQMGMLQTMGGPQMGVNPHPPPPPNGIPAPPPPPPPHPQMGMPQNSMCGPLQMGMGMPPNSMNPQQMGMGMMPNGMSMGPLPGGMGGAMSMIMPQNGMGPAHMGMGSPQSGMAPPLMGINPPPPPPPPN